MNDLRRQRVTGRRDGGRGPFFNSTHLDRPTELTRRSAAVVVSTLIVMVVVLAADHDAVASMPVSLTAANPDPADSDMDVFRDDDRFIAGVHRTGKGRHRQERNETKNKHGIFGILHGTLLGWGRSASRYPLQCGLDTSEICIGLTKYRCRCVAEKTWFCRRSSDQSQSSA
jgi:hypothetical protein